MLNAAGMFREIRIKCDNWIEVKSIFGVSEDCTYLDTSKLVNVCTEYSSERT